MSAPRDRLLVIEGCHVATADASGTEYPDGHLVIDGSRIVAVGPGTAPRYDGAQRIDARGCLATPGLVNTHQHLFQWITRGLAQQAPLLDWLTTLLPLWRHLDAELEHTAAKAAIASMVLTGCTTTTDHHYVFPRGGGDLLAAAIQAATEIGVRFHPCRGSMDLGRSRGGLVSDDAVEEADEILAASEDTITRYHDPGPGSMLRIALAPCTLFSASEELMTQTAQLARHTGTRLHTHVAETRDEVEYCRVRHTRTPVEYLEDLGWLGDDVWLAHGVHLDDRSIARLAATGSAVAHCPSSNARLGVGTAPVPKMLDAGLSVGLGVDGCASNESGSLAAELRQALLAARASHGPAALTARQVLQLSTIHGARCLGRAEEIGSLEAGKLADLALWRLDGLGHADIPDPVAALVLGPPAPLLRLLIGGRPVVADGALLTADTEVLARDARRAARELARRSGGA